MKEGKEDTEEGPGFKRLGMKTSCEAIKRNPLLHQDHQVRSQTPQTMHNTLTQQGPHQPHITMCPVVLNSLSLTSKLNASCNRQQTIPMPDLWIVVLDEEHVLIGLWSSHIIQRSHGDEPPKLSASHASFPLVSRVIVILVKCQNTISLDVKHAMTVLKNKSRTYGLKQPSPLDHGMCIHSLEKVTLSLGTPPYVGLNPPRIKRDQARGGDIRDLVSPLRRPTYPRSRDVAFHFLNGLTRTSEPHQSKRREGKGRNWARRDKRDGKRPQPQGQGDRWGD
ncbi:hypothetical protein VNO77_26746 [Canavalia gladiata]|uniref:Uncharacterized protein n=1 Tax=Canavalia gladiata TaxID=3824 RepID=A0AAN9KU42_CANGL